MEQERKGATNGTREQRLKAAESFIVHGLASRVAVVPRKPACSRSSNLGARTVFFVDRVNESSSLGGLNWNREGWERWDEADEVTKIIPRGVEDRFTSDEGICSFFLFMDLEPLVRMMYTYVTRRRNRGFSSEFYGRLMLDVIGLLCIVRRL